MWGDFFVSEGRVIWSYLCLFVHDACCATPQHPHQPTRPLPRASPHPLLRATPRICLLPQGVWILYLTAPPPRLSSSETAFFFGPNKRYLSRRFWNA